MLEEIEEDVLAPLDVVEDGDERRLGRDRLEQLAERPRDLVRRGRALASEDDVERLGRNGIELESATAAARAASAPRPPASR